MLSKSKIQSGRKAAVAAGLAIASLMGGAAYAAKGLVQDRRVTLAQAQDMAGKAAKSSSFPVTVNDLVLKELNRYVGTPEGREFMRAALAACGTNAPPSNRS